MTEIDPKLQAVFDWIDAHREEAITDLQRLVRQPSVSAQKIGQQECADLVVEIMHSDGLDARAHPIPGGPPCVFGYVPSSLSSKPF